MTSAPTPPNRPRYEVGTNRHPGLDGRPWGWIRDRETGRDVEMWSGAQDRAWAEARAAEMNAADPNLTHGGDA